MIWTSDAACNTTYVPREWQALTGQPVAQALGSGWLSVVHAHDRALVEAYWRKACGRRSEFWVVFRLLRPEAGPLWVLSGATPSFAPADRRFLGYMGAISEVAEPQPPEAVGALGPFRPAVSGGATAPVDALDVIADHMLTAHALAAVHQEGEVARAIDLGLFHVALRLAEREHHEDAPLH